MHLQMPPARKMRFSRNKGTHEERATSLPTGASSAAASSSTGNKRGRVPRPSSQAAPLGSRSMMQRALDSSAAKSLADQRASLAASRRERAARRAASPDGMNTPPPMASRNPSSEMSSGGKKVIYHFEAFGEPLERRGTVLATFRATFEPKGWQLISLRQKYQADSSSCGVWLQVVCDAWLRYVDSDAFGTASFESFLERELAAEGVRDLYKCRGATKTAAAGKSREFILGQRADMRGRLVQAALAGKLKCEAASLSGFAPSVAQDLDLEEYDDEELE